MEVKNEVMPNDQQMVGFNELGKEKPIFMVNLLKFKEKAEYADKRETSLTGEEAYTVYGKEVQGHLEKVGGKVVFTGKVSRLTIGEVEELWDQVAIAMYPNRRAMLEMISNAEYIKSAEHRIAGLAGQLNIETNSPSGF